MTRISLLPLDVGFDLKVHDTAVNLPEGVNEAVFLNEAGEEETATGSRVEIAHRLIQAGYTIEPCRDDCQGCPDRAPGMCIIDGQYEYYCQKHGFSPRRPLGTKKLDLNGP
jgi:hypothetical protein